MFYKATKYLFLANLDRQGFCLVLDLCTTYCSRAAASLRRCRLRDARRASDKVVEEELWSPISKKPFVSVTRKKAYRAISICIQIISVASKMRMERVAHMRREKPATCTTETGQSSFSQPSPRLTIQIASVLQASVTLRAVALTRRVTLIPKKLKPPIEKAMMTPDNMTRELPII